MNIKYKMKSRVLSFVICFAVLFSMMPITAFAAAEIPYSDTQANGAWTYTWVLEAENTGTDFYEKVGEKNSGYKRYPDKTYITTSRYGADPDKGFFWATDCKSHTFTDGTYYVYLYSQNTDRSTNRMEYIINVQVRHTINISVSGAPSGYGGVMVNGSAAGSSQLVKPGGSITFEVADVPGYEAFVTYGDASCAQASNNKYTFENINQKFTFSVKYLPEGIATVEFSQPEGATITVNGETDGSVQVVSGWPYTVTVKANNSYTLDKILLDNEPQSITNPKEITFTSTAGGPGSTHTVSVSTEKTYIKVKETATAHYDITEIFKAIYLESNADLSADILSTQYGDNKPLIVECYENDQWSTLVSMYQLSGKLQTKVRLKYDGVYSNECTLTLADNSITANGDIEKEYTGKAVELSMQNGVNFNWPSNGSSTLSIFKFYDSDKNQLSGTPVEPGSYYVRLKMAVQTYFEYEGSTITGPVITTYSDYIPIKIVSVDVTAIKNISGDKTYDGKPAALDFTVVTQSGEESKTWDFTDGVCANFSLYTPTYQYKKKTQSGYNEGLPTDAGTYDVKVTVNDKSATGTITIKHVAHDIGKVSQNGTVYDSTDPAKVVLSRENTDLKGTLALEAGTTLTAGTGTYTWVFTPDNENYETITGTVELNVTEDVVEKIEYSGTLAKSGYTYGDTFSIDGLTVTATYTSGRTEDVTNKVSYDDKLAVGQTGVELSYSGKTCTVTGITVDRAKLTVSGAYVTDREYDGTKVVTIENVFINGVLNGDEVSVVMPDDLTGLVEESNVKEYTVVTLQGELSITGKDKDNYILVQPTGEVSITDSEGNPSSMNITKRTLTIKALPQSIYLGKELDQTKYVTEGLLEGHEVSGIVLSAELPETAGTVPITVSVNRAKVTQSGTVYIMTMYYNITVVGTANVTVLLCGEHDFEGNNGFCKKCDAYQPAELKDGVYQITNAGNLYWFAEKVNKDNENYGSANAVLTTDITVNSDVLSNTDGQGLRIWTPIGSGAEYTGTFNGGGHTVSGLYYSGEATKLGLVGNNSGTVKNVGIADTYFYSSSNNASVGGVVGGNDGTVSKCWFNGEVKTGGADSYTGGVVGYNGYTKLVENCYNAGTVTNTYTGDGTITVGGVVGHNFAGTVKNSYNIGAVSALSTAGANVARVGSIIGCNFGFNYGGSWGSGTAIAENCYALYSDLAPIGYKPNGSGLTTETNVSAMSSDDFSSGKVAYLLNGSTSQGDLVWYQTIGKDTYPKFSGGTVYPVTATYCDGGTKPTYSNTKSDIVTSHYYTSKPAFNWADDYTTCTATFTCAKNSTHETKTVDCTVTSDTSDPTKKVYTASVTMQGQTYTDVKEVAVEIISVDITWSDMEFTYSDGTWNTDSHTYGEGSWTADNNSNCVTVTNSGDVDVNVEVAYGTERSDISGKITADGTNEATFPVSLPKDESKKYYLILSGKPSENLNKTDIGTVTVTIVGGNE